ncbi:hypothetical protein [Glaciimonas sp. GG7]
MTDLTIPTTLTQDYPARPFTATPPATPPQYPSASTVAQTAQ